jgi:hypothetical protein
VFKIKWAWQNCHKHQNPLSMWNAYLMPRTLRSTINQKVQQSHYRPEQVLRVPAGWGSQISRQSAHEDGTVVSHMHQPLLPPMKYSWYSFLLEAESTPQPEGLCQWKLPMIPSGIEPITFWLVAQGLNQLRHKQRAPIPIIQIWNNLKRYNNQDSLLFTKDKQLLEAKKSLIPKSRKAINLT